VGYLQVPELLLQDEDDSPQNCEDEVSPNSVAFEDSRENELKAEISKLSEAILSLKQPSAVVDADEWDSEAPSI
jgi:hypothetical protein